VCKRVFVSGRVQGVGYRDFARRAARKLGVHGYAVNLADGRVEVLVCGGAEAVDTLVERLRQGPPWSTVSGIEVEPAECGVVGFS
jgi:acylphosphatase